MEKYLPNEKRRLLIRIWHWDKSNMKPLKWNNIENLKNKHHWLNFENKNKKFNNIEINTIFSIILLYQ